MDRNVYVCADAGGHLDVEREDIWGRIDYNWPDAYIVAMQWVWKKRMYAPQGLSLSSGKIPIKKSIILLSAIH